MFIFYIVFIYSIYIYLRFFNILVYWGSEYKVISWICKIILSQNYIYCLIFIFFLIGDYGGIFSF